MNEPSETSPDAASAEHSAAPAPSPAESATNKPSTNKPATAMERFGEVVAARQTQGDDGDVEQTLWQGNYSSKAMVGPALIVLAVSIALVVVSGIYGIPDWRWASLAVVVIWLLLAARYMYRRLGIHYELTTQRFIHQTGVISRRIDRIEVIEIEDVSIYQRPMERVFGIGTIDITSNDRSHPHLVMPGIADVRRVASMIDDVRRRERKRRSLHIRS